MSRQKTKFQGKKKKKRPRQKQKELTTEQEESIGSTDVCKEACIEESHPTESECDFQSYWAEHGEYLVWQTWVEKYSEYMNTDMMKHVSVPVVEEVEIVTDETENTMENECGATEEPLDKSISGHDASDSRKTEGDVAAEEGCSNTTEVKGCNKSFNEAIEETMKNLAELDVTDGGVVANEADAENQMNAERIQNVERVNAFHDYCVSPQWQCEPGGDQEMRHYAEEDFAPSTENETNYDDQWKALWDEHYQEMYWYYYSKYQEFIPTETGWIPREQCEPARNGMEWFPVEKDGSPEVPECPGGDYEDEHQSGDFQHNPLDDFPKEGVQCSEHQSLSEEPSDAGKKRKKNRKANNTGEHLFSSTRFAVSATQ